MIIVKLMGGLGNQMFQYAAGRQLALLKSTELKVDKGLLGGEIQPGVTPRQLEINLLNTVIEYAGQHEIDSFKKYSSNSYFRFIQRKMPFIFKNLYFAESGLQFNPDFFNLPSNVYLDGFWQSEKYFLPFREKLMQEFIPKQEMNDVNKNHQSKILSTNSVSIHFRRGDYVTNPEASTYHGVLSMDYYTKAIQEISMKTKDPHFFIFSDDSLWVKENFKIDFPSTFIDNNLGKDAIYDLQLMSSCRHNIIANSSFSWWGAWLNNYPDKLVVAPKKWFNNSPIDTTDLLPKDWIQL